MTTPLIVAKPEGSVGSNEDSERGNEALIAELLAGRSLRNAAAAAGVSYATARRRADDPAFRAALEAAGRELVEGVVRRLAGAALRAADTLLDLLEAESESVRLGAARTLVGMVPEVRGALNVDERLARMEAALRARKLEAVR